MESSFGLPHNISYTIHQQYHRFFHWNLFSSDQFSPPHFSCHCPRYQIWCSTNVSPHSAQILQGFPFLLRLQSKFHMNGLPVRMWSESLLYLEPISHLIPSFSFLFIHSHCAFVFMSQRSCQVNSCLGDLAFLFIYFLFFPLCLGNILPELSVTFVLSVPSSICLNIIISRNLYLTPLNKILHIQLRILVSFNLLYFLPST